MSVMSDSDTLCEENGQLGPFSVTEFNLGNIQANHNNHEVDFHSNDVNDNNSYDDRDKHTGIVVGNTDIIDPTDNDDNIDSNTSIDEPLYDTTVNTFDNIQSFGVRRVSDENINTIFDLLPRVTQDSSAINTLKILLSVQKNTGATVKIHVQTVDGCTYVCVKSCTLSPQSGYKHTSRTFIIVSDIQDDTLLDATARSYLLTEPFVNRSDIQFHESVLVFMRTKYVAYNIYREGYVELRNVGQSGTGEAVLKLNKLHIIQEQIPEECTQIDQSEEFMTTMTNLLFTRSTMRILNTQMLN